MTKEAQIIALKSRIHKLENVPKENANIIRKLKRKLAKLQG